MSRNVVLVTVDSLRADSCGFMGYERDTTPAIDELASDATVFENAVAPGPNTPSSMPVVFTGRHVHGVSHGVTNRDTIRRHLSRTRTIPERLSERGYATIGFTSNPFTSRYFGFDDGFDEFTDFLRSDRSLRNRVISRWMDGRFVAGLRFGLNMAGRGDLSLTWEQYYDRLVASVEAAAEPFFLWVFLLEPHWPYRPPARFRRDTSIVRMYYYNWLRSKFSSGSPGPRAADAVRSLYDGAVRHVDEFVERLRADLSGWDPALVLHGDHGEAFGEHGTYGHGRQLYEENVHVPLVVDHGGRGDRIERPVSLRSLPEVIDGLADDVADPDLAEHARPWVSAHAVDRAAIRGRTWKYIRGEDGSELFDLEGDPGESDAGTDGRLSGLCDRLLDRERRLRAEYHHVSEATDGIDVEKL